MKEKYIHPLIVHFSILVANGDVLSEKHPHVMIFSSVPVKFKDKPFGCLLCIHP